VTNRRFTAFVFKILAGF